MLRVDLEARTVAVAVRDLVQRAADIPRAMGVIGRVRSELGSEIHREYLHQREANVDGFTAEVSLVLNDNVDGFEIRLRGRADGVITSSDGPTVVEEVKSLGATRGELAQLTPESMPAACMQLRLYALMLSRQLSGLAVEARLIVISVIDGSRRQIAVPWSPERTHRELVALVRSQIARARRVMTRARARSRVAEALQFPYPEPRPYQQELADTVAAGLDEGRPVLAMAPTGIGKTVGAMLPALRFALRHDAALFFLTAKTTQQQRVAATFRDLCDASGLEPGTLQATTLRAKSGMCPPGTLLCHPDHCSHLNNVLDATARNNALDELTGGAEHVHPDDVYRCGEARRLCPYALSLALSRRVDLVICDVNYVYDPFVSLRPTEQDDAERPAVVVLDEAHNLFDRARSYYSPFLPLAEISNVLGAIERGEYRAPPEATEQLRLAGLESDLDATALFERAGAHLRELSARIESCVSETAEAALPTLQGCRPAPARDLPWPRLARDAAHLLVQYAHYKHVHALVRAEDPLVEILQRVHRMHELVRTPVPEIVHYLAPGAEAPEGAGVGMLCVNPAARLTPRYEGALGTIAMSATLSPLSYYADVLGFGPLNPLTTSLPSPFPEEHRHVVIVPTVSTTYRERGAAFDAIATLIERTVGIRPGHYVAYFPSFAFLRSVRDRLQLPPRRVLVQERGMSQSARQAVLARLTNDLDPLLLLAVMGGIFAEGIDLPGEALVGAIVVGPGLPQVGFERSLMQHYFDETTDDGFARAMLYPAMQRVIQAAGRVHRSPEDRGVIVLMGRRFATDRYARCLPAWWSRYGVGEIISEDPFPQLADFWDLLAGSDV